MPGGQQPLVHVREHDRAGNAADTDPDLSNNEATVTSTSSASCRWRSTSSRGITQNPINLGKRRHLGRGAHDGGRRVRTTACVRRDDDRPDQRALRPRGRRVRPRPAERSRATARATSSAVRARREHEGRRHRHGPPLQNGQETGIGPNDTQACVKGDWIDGGERAQVLRLRLIASPSRKTSAQSVVEQFERVGFATAKVMPGRSRRRGPMVALKSAQRALRAASHRASRSGDRRRSPDHALQINC